jgi:hypothetical protein
MYIMLLLRVWREHPGGHGGHREAQLSLLDKDATTTATLASIQHNLENSLVQPVLKGTEGEAK